MRVLIVLLFVSASLLCATALPAQVVAEARLADTHYRFFDVSFTQKNGLVLDAFYVGVPGSNELNLGGGYAVKRGALTLTPLLYAVAGKEDGQRGVKIALLAAFDRDGWKLLAFGGAFVRTAGSVDNYQLLDTADLTHTIGKSWELGVQGGFFRAGGSWNTQIGPLIKLNDTRGAWAASYRFGSDPEFRVGRVLVF